MSSSFAIDVQIDRENLSLMTWWLGSLRMLCRSHHAKKVSFLMVFLEPLPKQRSLIGCLQSKGPRLIKCLILQLMTSSWRKVILVVGSMHQVVAHITRSLHLPRCLVLMMYKGGILSLCQ